MATPPPLEHDQPTTVILLPPTSEPPFVPYGLGPMPFLPPTSEPLYTPAVSSTSGPLVMPFVPPTHEVPFFLSTSGSFVTTEKPTNVPDQDLRDDSLFWDQYVKEADSFDRELVKGLGGDLDALLIFAGLFSAVNTAFIIESYQDLKPDPAESGGTNELLRTLIQAVNNSTSVTTPPVDFTPSSHAVVVNALFFASLLCSLFAAFGAVLAKQWLNEYERTGDNNRAPHARARQRHTKYLGMKNYRCEVIMQALGTVLQISLLLFFLALTIWLWGINHTIGIIVILGVVMTIAFYLITTVISIYDPASPFSTRFSAILRELGHFAKTTDALIATGMDELDGKCMTWISNNATMFESVAGMARVATYLPDDIRRDERLDHTHVGPKLLRSIISSNAIRLGLTNGNLFSTVNTIRNAMTSWEGVPISLACDVLAQLHEILRTTVYKDPVVSESIALILEHVDIDIPSDLLVQTRRPAYETLVDLVLIPSLTLEGKRAALSILWRYSLSLCTLMWPGNTPETPVPTEGEWQWKVVCVLVDTASANGMDDPSMERLEFRVAWAAALSRKTLDVRRLLYNGPREEHGPSASLWLRSFGERQFECYLIDRVQISQFRMENRIDLHKAAMDCLVLRTSIFIPRAFIIPPPDDQTSFLELGFDVDKEYKPEFIAALYEWYLNQKCSARSYPTSFISKQYVRFAILEFLEEQLGPKP